MSTANGSFNDSVESMTTTLTHIARRFSDIGDVIAADTVLLGLGEPTHGVPAFPLLRNDLLADLVDRGYRSIVLETDFSAASIVDDYARGTPLGIDDVLATGFSHGFGKVPGNRELVEWLRSHNAELPAHEQVRFYGFDAPVEYQGAPSPRESLTRALPTELPDHVVQLLGDDAEWTNPQAMYDASASIGRSDRARELRVFIESLTPSTHARTALALLRYHEQMATPGDDRMDRLLAVRAEMMAENLLAIVAEEQRRGPTLAFAHNAHLVRSTSWANAGALVARTLGDRYVVLASDANPHSAPGTLQGLLADATDRRALFPSAELRDALPSDLADSAPMIPGHIPLTRADLDGCDAVLFLADSDGQRVEYW